MYTYNASRDAEKKKHLSTNLRFVSRTLIALIKESRVKSFNFDPQLRRTTAQLSHQSHLLLQFRRCHDNTTNGKKRCEITSAFYTVDQSTNYSKSNCVELLPFEAQPSALLNYLNKNISYENMDKL